MICDTVGIDGQVGMCCPPRPPHESIHSRVTQLVTTKARGSWERPYSTAFQTDTQSGGSHFLPGRNHLRYWSWKANNYTAH